MTRALAPPPPGLQHDTVEHLALIERTLGPLPTTMAQAATGEARDWFRDDGGLKWPAWAPDAESEKHVRKQRRLEVRCADSKAVAPWAPPPPTPTRSWTPQDMISPAHSEFLALIRQLLQPDPRDRYTAAEALDSKALRGLPTDHLVHIPRQVDERLLTGEAFRSGGRRKRRRRD